MIPDSFQELIATKNEKIITMFRLLVGCVFFAEGVQKFVYPALRGPGRFESMGFPAPEFFGYFVGGAEIIFGLLLLVGLITRFASSGTFVIMIVAILTTKIPILIGSDIGIFNVRELDYYGFWAFVHESRNDLSMLACSYFLMIKGAGALSLDLKLSHKNL